MNHFRHIYNLGEHWYKKFKKKYKDLYEFVFDNEKLVVLVYDQNKDHVLTYLPDDGTVFTDLPINKVYEDAMGGVGAPMATINNTPGVGNVTPAGVGSIGSGDNFGNSIGNITYTQNGKAKKKKRVVKKRAKKVNENYRYEEIENFISDLDDKIGSNMEMYLPDDEKIELYDLLKSGVKIKAIYGDSDEWAREKDIDWDEWIDRFETRKIQPLKAKGWEEFWVDEQGDEGREVILIKRRHAEHKPLDEENLNPYDKVGISMAKKMKVTPPFKKKKDSKNQNAMTQRKYEHQLITLAEFTKQLNESVLPEFTEDTPLNAYEVSGATYTTGDTWETTVKDLKRGGWEFDDDDIENLSNGSLVSMITYNRAGTARKLVLQRADAKK